LSSSPSSLSLKPLQPILERLMVLPADEDPFAAGQGGA
jgi:hypothetical protein